MDFNLENYEVVSRDSVGLGPKRPFRFCTMHYGTKRIHLVQPGDDPNPTVNEHTRTRRALEVFAPFSIGVPPHRHDYYELVLIRRGSSDHLCNHGRQQLERGDMIVMTPRTVHAFDKMDNITKTNIYVQPDWLLGDLQLLWGEKGILRYLLADTLFGNTFQADHIHLRLTEEEVLTCEREIHDLHLEARNTEPSMALFNACFLKILWMTNQAFLRMEQENLISTLPLRKELWTAVEIIEYAITHNQNFNAETIAHSLGMSRFRLHRMFKTELGISPMGFYQQRRIQHARRMLEDLGSNVTEVAYHFGFSDAAHFGRVFKKVVGETPAAYRSRITQNAKSNTSSEQ